MSDPSFMYRAGTRGPSPLTPNTDGTYDWATLQKSREGVKLLPAKAGAPLPAFTQAIPYTDNSGDTPVPANSTFAVEASPKWFSFVGSEIDDQGVMRVTIAVQAGKTVEKGKVVGVVTRWSGLGMPGSGKTKEYFYEVK